MIGSRSYIPPVVKNLLIINGLIFLCSMFFFKWAPIYVHQPTEKIFLEENEALEFRMEYLNETITKLDNSNPKKIEEAYKPILIDPEGVYSGPIYDYLALHSTKNKNFKVWQFVTHMFVHDLGWTHIFFNMFALWMFGAHIETRWGSKRFLNYYILTGIGAGLLHTIIMSSTGAFPIYTIMFGASGAVFGILLAFGMVYPNTQIMLLIPPMPIKAKYLVIGYGLLSLILGYADTGDGVAHFAHLGGMLFGLLFFLYWKIKGVFY